MPWQNYNSMPFEDSFRNQIDLEQLNTFGVKVTAECMIPISSEEGLQEVLKNTEGPFRILGGGSNILFTQDVNGVLLKNEIKGMEVVERNGHWAIVKVGGGERWHDFVCWCLDQNLGGIENLSLIPGTVGAAPIQNIGAYGIELKDVFYKLSAIRLSDGRIRSFSPADCTFDYRDSIFKKDFKGQYFITRVYIKLTSKDHQIRTRYGAIQDKLLEWEIQKPSIQDVSQAVIHIRKQKLPDPEKLGNAGSFFKNPIIPTRHFEQLKKRFPDIVHYPAGEGQIKVPAGWLVERCDWKGKRVGAVGCYEKQALVIVNYDNATGPEIWLHAQKVMKSVFETFGVMLQPEVNVW